MRAVHPEAGPDEIHIGNVFRCDFRRIGWATKRIGKQAMGSNGKMLSGTTQRPVFVKRAEIEREGVPIPDGGPVDHRW